MISTFRTYDSKNEYKRKIIAYLRGGFYETWSDELEFLD
jgi:hypothetical protein